MSHRTRMGIWLENDSDFKSVAADLKELVDPDEIDAEQRFIHWETTQGHDVGTFWYLARKYPELTCKGYSENEAMWIGPDTGHLDITINKGDVDIKESGCGNASIFDGEEYPEWTTVNNKKITVTSDKPIYVIYAINKEYGLSYRLYHKMVSEERAMEDAQLLADNMNYIKLYYSDSANPTKNGYVNADEIKVCKEYKVEESLRILTKPKIVAPF